MSGYESLEGHTIMAGSPDLDMIFADCDIPTLLKGGHVIVGLNRLKEVAEKHGHTELKHRCDLVEKLIIAAGRLITWPDGKQTEIANAEKAVEILNVQ